MVALYPRRAKTSGIERVALSFGLSVAVVILIGLILNYTPWGIRVESILYSIASFIFIASVIAWLRQKKLVEKERFGFEFRLRIPSLGTDVWGRALSITLVLAVLGALGMMGYAIATPKVGQKFTEFYILGSESKATDYPRELKMGEEGKVTVGIVNREYAVVNYRVEVRVNGVRNNEVGPVTLGNSEKWEGEVIFTPQVAGMNQKVEFLLYKRAEAEPCFEPLRLWFDVRE